MDQVFVQPAGTIPQEQSLSEVFGLPAASHRAGADAGTPLATENRPGAKKLYRYRDTRAGHEHFEVDN